MKIIKIFFLEAHSESGKVRARVDIEFDWFNLNGFKIIEDLKTKRLYVTPPSYLSQKGWRILFKTKKPEDWQEMQRQILNEYEETLIKESLSETVSDKE